MMENYIIKLSLSDALKLFAICLLPLLMASFVMYNVYSGNVQNQFQSQFTRFVSNQTSVAELSWDVTKDCNKDDTYCKYATLSNWIYSNINYSVTINPNDIGVNYTLKYMKGDCKNYAVLMASLLKYQFIESYFVTQESHVCLLVKFYNKPTEEYQYHMWNCDDYESYGLIGKAFTFK